MKKSTQSEGFTLVETLVALAIVAMVLLGIAPLFLNATRSNASAFDYTMASSLVREKIDEVKQLPQIDPATGLTPCELVTTPIAADPNPGAHTDTPAPSVYNTSVTHPPYTRTWTVINYDLVNGIPDYANPNPPTRGICNPAGSLCYDVKEIRVTVAATNTQGSPGLRRSSSRYLYANPDPTRADAPPGGPCP